VRPIRNLRRWIGAILFVSTVINYIDRQTLSLLSPYLKGLYHWTNSDYANLLIGLALRTRLAKAYAEGGWIASAPGEGSPFLFSGTRLYRWLLDWPAGSTVSRLSDFFRALANLPTGRARQRPFSEWFPKRERALASALFDSGSSIGGAVAPFIVFAIYNHRVWRSACAIPGMLGFVWLPVWRFAYYPPKDHPRLSHEERQMILSDAAGPDAFAEKPRSRWVDLLRIPQTWE